MRFTAAQLIPDSLYVMKEGKIIHHNEAAQRLLCRNITVHNRAMTPKAAAATSLPDKSFE
ncbi:hypothetical protein ACTID9_15430 [Brevibacillus fluminis]|uniref:hypothetical protein n=1 Tax=Brevibacillus fluminis TaxID=511487 RepID=UPI003F8BFFDD